MQSIWTRFLSLKLNLKIAYYLSIVCMKYGMALEITEYKLQENRERNWIEFEIIYSINNIFFSYQKC